MYSFIIKKNKGDKDNLLNILLSEISNLYKEINLELFFISFPGYLSKSKKSCDEFITKFPFENGYILKPLNVTSFNVGTNQYTNQSYLNEQIGNNKLFFKELDDHSKIIALIEFDKGDLNMSEKIRKGNFKVHTLVIGSSNLSNNTYYNYPTPKGECDVVLIDYNLIKNKLNSKKPLNDDKIFLDMYRDINEKLESIDNNENITNKKTKKTIFLLNKEIKSNTKSLKEVFINIFEL